MVLELQGYGNQKLQTVGKKLQWSIVLILHVSIKNQSTVIWNCPITKHGTKMTTVPGKEEVYQITSQSTLFY